MTDVRTEAPQLTDPLDARDHVQGPGDAPLEVVQYGDYECPYCTRAHPVIREMRDELGDRMRFGYRHFPLYRQHPHAQNAAEAAEAAAAQGRFWAMHRQLYDNRSALDRMHLVQHAENLNLDTERFEREIDEEAHRERILADYESGRASGVEGTPALFVNGRRYDGDPDAATADLGDGELSVVARAYLKKLNDVLRG
jgi:protein-disulfide isomerase